MIKKTNIFVALATLLLAAMALAACSKEETKMPSGTISDFRVLALDFTKSLAARDYPKAYAMTSQEYRKKISVDHLRTRFETIVPLDWGPIGPIQVGETMTTWPGKKSSDLGWACVSIGGNMYSEAIILIVTLDNGEQKIREVEFGRP